MTTTKVTDKVIATANKMFTLIDDVNEKTAVVETCAEEAKEDFIKETNAITAQWQVVAQTALRGAVKLAVNQQNIFSSVVSSIKKEAANSYVRTAQLFSASK